MKNKILVIGGTGTVGSSVVDELKQGETDYQVLTRNKEKAETLSSKGIRAVVGTLGDWPTMQPVMEGINSIFMVTSAAFDMVDLHKGLIDMAVKNGVKKIVRLSAEPASYSKGMHMYEHHAEADEYLKQSGLEYVILRPHYFMQNMFMHTDFIKSQNSFAQYLGDTQIPMIDVRDIAKAAFLALTTDNFNNKTYVLTGPNAISFGDIAKVMSNKLGRNIQYISLPYKDQEAGFKMAGIPDWQTEDIMKIFKNWVDKKVSEPTSDFETITNSKAISIETFVNDHSQIFQ